MALLPYKPIYFIHLFESTPVMKTYLIWLQSFLVEKPEDIDILTRKGLLQDLLWRIRHVDIGALGAQLAYFFLLSFFPLMIFLLGIVP